MYKWYVSVKIIEYTPMNNKIHLYYNSFAINGDIVSNMGTITLYKNIVRLNTTRAIYTKSYHLFFSYRVLFVFFFFHWVAWISSLREYHYFLRNCFDFKLIRICFVLFTRKPQTKYELVIRRRILLELQLSKQTNKHVPQNQTKLNPIPTS